MVSNEAVDKTNGRSLEHGHNIHRETILPFVGTIVVVPPLSLTPADFRRAANFSNERICSSIRLRFQTSFSGGIAEEAMNDTRALRLPIRTVGRENTLAGEVFEVIVRRTLRRAGEQSHGRRIPTIKFRRDTR